MEGIVKGLEEGARERGEGQGKDQEGGCSERHAGEAG